MHTTTGQPVVAVTACIRSLQKSTFHAVVERYIAAVVHGTGALPLIIPALGDEVDMRPILERVDGVLITGSPSNIEPQRYGALVDQEVLPKDPARDGTVLPLVRACIDMGLPLLGICRGFQEMNVALGGTLHTQVHEISGRLDHRGGPGGIARRFRPKHMISLTPGGLLHQLAGADQVRVNSVHGQAIDRLAPGLKLEAVAPDGTIEGITVAGSRGFAVGVQFHPEWQFAASPFYTALFTAFGAAAAEYAGRRDIGQRQARLSA